MTALLSKSPLVTITGSGGCGKTRLALQIAARISTDFLDGVRFAELAAVADAESLGRVISIALGLTPTPGQPIADEIAAGIGDKRILLVSNCNINR